MARGLLMLIRSYQERLARAEDIEFRILKFLRDQCYSCPKILAQVAGLSERAIYKKLNALLRKGWLSSYKYEGIPFRVWGITLQGLAIAWGDDEVMEHRNPFQPSRTKPLMLAHELATQQIRIIFEKAGGTEWIPGHLLPARIKQRPDAAIICKEKKIYIEYESTIKSRQRYQQIWSNYLQEISKNVVDEIYYVCPNEKFSNSLRRVFNLLEVIPVAGEKVKLRENHRSKFSVFSLFDKTIFEKI